MEDSFKRSPAWLLIRSSIPAKLAFVDVAEQFDLTYMQLLTLCLVDSCKEGPAMQGITGILGCDASNVTGLIDKLVGQGFLERTESLRDRRAKIITLTRKGERTRQDAMRTFAKSDFLNVLTSDEVDILVRILAKLQPQNS